MSYFTNKVIIITGATSGIGRATALLLAEKDVHLILAARNNDSLIGIQQECIQKGANCIAVPIDMGSSDSIANFAEIVFSKFKTIDVLINSAGVSQRSLAEETSMDVVRKIMEVNFFGHVTLTKLLWPLLINSEQATIVLMSSLVGTFGFPLRSAYAASKHALEGYFESWMLECKNPNVNFLTVAPGPTKTNMAYAALTANGSANQKLDPDLENGMTPEVCAKKIINGIVNRKRKIYIAKKEMVLVIMRKYLPFLFFKVVKKLKVV